MKNLFRRKYKTGDLITLKSDGIIRVVRFERNNKVVSNWITLKGEPKQIESSIDDVILIEKYSPNGTSIGFSWEEE